MTVPFMLNYKIILIASILLIAIGTKKVYDMTRGLRNNNPGNIRKTSDKWQGLKPNQSGDDAFFQFVSAEYGIRALAKILLNYNSNYGLRTVNDIIYRWAPPVENDTGSYVRSVANGVGVAPDNILDFSDFGTLTKLVRAIIKHENGIDPYSDATVNKGVSMAVA